MVDVNMMNVNRVVIREAENKVLEVCNTPYHTLDIDIYTKDNGKITLSLFSSDNAKVDIINQN